MEYEYIKILPNGWVECESQGKALNPPSVNAWHYLPYNGSSGGWTAVCFSGGSMRFEGEAAIEIDHFMSEYIKHHEN